MKRSLLIVVFAAAVLLYLPSARYGFVQDDLAIIARNPAVHSLGAAFRALDDPYWPQPSQAGLYRPVTILSYAVDWSIGGGSPSWFHLMNALWHGLAAVLVTLILARWLPVVGAVAGGLVFAVHPVHVEGVASLVSRAELLVAVAMFGAVLCARRRWWAAAVVLAAIAMFSKEHGVVTGVLILADDWLGRREQRAAYPRAFYTALAVVTVGFLAVWWRVGQEATADTATAFYGAGTMGRLAMALPAVLRATTLLVWPFSLSADYGPQVIPVRDGFSLAALGGIVVIGVAIGLAVWGWQRAPVLALAAIAAMLAYLPTSNLLFPAGVVLAERNLYMPVILVAALVGIGAERLAEWRGAARAAVAVGLLVLLLGGRSLGRLPVWESNRAFLLTTLVEHPESYRAHVWAAAIFSGMGDTAGARREYRRAEQLFDRDPNLDAAHAYYLMTLGDTTEARPRIERARRRAPREHMALRAEFLLRLRRGDRAGAQALADSALAWSRWDEAFYRGLPR